LINENRYLQELDLREVSRAFWELRIPYFHHEVVKQIVEAALAGPADTLEPLCAALRSLCGMITEDQMVKGLQRAVETGAWCLLPGEDDDAAPVALAHLVHSAEASLPSGYVETLPQSIQNQIDLVRQESSAGSPAPGSPLMSKMGAKEAAEELLQTWSLVGAAKKLAICGGGEVGHFVEVVITEAILGQEVQRDLVSHTLHSLQQMSRASALAGKEEEEDEDEDEDEEEEAHSSNQNNNGDQNTAPRSQPQAASPQTSSGLKVTSQQGGSAESVDCVLDVVSLENGIGRILHSGKKGLCDGEEGERLTRFLVRLVHEKTLPPSSVMELARPCRHGSAAASVLAGVREEIAQSGVGQGHGGMGGRGLRRATPLARRDHVMHARNAISSIMVRFLAEKSPDHVASSLIELNSPYMHHEAVKVALLLALQSSGNKGDLSVDTGVGGEEDHSPEGVTLVSRLLASLCANGIFQTEAIRRGFEEVIQDLAPLSEEVATAPRSLAHLLSQAVLDGCLRKGDLPEVPEAMRCHMATMDGPDNSPVVASF